MFGVSTVPESPPDGRDVRRFRGLSAGAIGALVVLGWYLFRSVEATGDGAAYVLQALDGSPWDRSVHAFVLAPLWVWVRAGVALGLDPAAAANLFSAAWTVVGLGAATALGGELLAVVDPSRRPALAALLAPTTIAASATAWHAGLFCEVYGPLAAATTVVAWALRRGRDRTAGAAMVAAALMHPGAVALGPGLLLVGGVELRSRRALLGVGATLAAVAVGVGLLGADWWTGGRGVLEAAPPDRSPAAAVRDGVRLFTRDLGPASVAIVVGAVAAFARSPRAVVGLVVLFAGATLGLDRWSDNPGQLPTLFAAAAFAPLALRVPFGSSDIGRVVGRAWPPLLAAVALLGVAEATSRHDAVARKAVVEATALAADCDADGPDWATSTRRRLACRSEGPAEPW